MVGTKSQPTRLRKLTMKRKELLDQAHKLADRFCITDGKKFRLKDIDPGDTAWLKEEHKPQAEEALQEGIAALTGLQEMLYAQDRWSVLLIFQAMDAAGKDGAIKHVMSGVNPQGCQVFSFKAPTSEELDHDYLWRCMRCLPERGRIGIFNRSYYEETLVVRVHPEPSPSKSPSDANEEPKLSKSASVGPPFNWFAIFTLLFTVPFVFMNST